MNTAPAPPLDSVFPLYLVLDRYNRITAVSDQLRLEIGESCVGQLFIDGFIVKRPVLAAHVPDIRQLGRQLFLFITHDGDFAMRGQLLPPAADESNGNVTMVITPWLTWMQENRPSRLISSKSFPIADAQLELQLYLNTQQMMIDDMNNLLVELQKATDQAVAASMVKSQFVNHISHELRTPLNGIVSAAELLKSEAVSPHVEQLVSVIGKSSEALLGIINQILYYSQMSSGNATLSVKEFDPAQPGRDILEITSLLAKQHHIQIQLDIQKSLPASVSGDALRVHNVLLNLVGNAIKHCNGADVLVRISMPPQQLSARPVLLYEVQDSGPGVPIADRQRIFEPFATIDNTRKSKDSTSGLGLAIVKSEVELMGGNIGVTDTLTGKGSLFWFEIPVTISQVNTVAKTLSNRPLELTGTVLVVDDNQINRQLCKLQIEKFGLHVDAVDSGARAIELAKLNPYQLILMDIQMPGMDGLEATQLIRQLPQHSKTPMVAWTANACETEAKTYALSGFNDTLIKPVNNHSLSDMLSKWLLKTAP